MKFLRFSLFPIFAVLFLLLIPNVISPAFSEVIINYQNLSWAGTSCAGEFSQTRIQGVFPTQIANVDYRPESTTICIKYLHNLNGTDYGFFIKLFQTIDYATYVMTASPTGGNTSVFKVNGAQVGAIGYNTSFTHVNDNVYLVGLFNHASTTFDEGTSQSGWTGLGVSSCTDYTTLTGTIFHEFVYQLKNDTSAGFAWELFIDGNYWCTYLVTAATDPDRVELGNTDDLGTGAGTGNLNSRYREFEITTGRHIYSLNLAGEGGDFPPGNKPTTIVASATDSEGNFRSLYSLGETFILDGLLLDISGDFEPVSNQLLTFTRLTTTLGQSNTGSTGHANISIFVTGEIGETRTYTITYAGSQSQNLTSATAIVIIDIIGIGSTPGNIQTSITISIHDLQGRSRTNIIHGESIFFQASMRGSDGLNPEFKQIEFFIDKNNGGTLSRFTFATTLSNGVAQTQFFAFGDDWIGTQRVQARFLGDSTHIASDSEIFTFIVISSAGEISIILELDPATVISGNRFDALTRLNINPATAPPEPIIGETVRLWWSVGGNWKFLKGGSTSNLGIFIQGFTAPLELGTFTMKSNSTVNSVNVESTNQTLTVVSLIDNIPSKQLPDGGGVAGANLDDFFPDIDDIDFGFGTNGGNGILLWMIFFMMFAFGGIFAMNRTFPEAMSSNVVIAWFVMMFGATTGISFGLQWITLNFVILLLAPIALIGGIIMLKIFRGGGTT